MRIQQLMLFSKLFISADMLMPPAMIIWQQMTICTTIMGLLEPSIHRICHRILEKHLQLHGEIISAPDRLNPELQKSNRNAVNNAFAMGLSLVMDK